MTVNTNRSYSNGSMQWSSSAARCMADSIHNDVREMVRGSRLSRKSDGIALAHRTELAVGELLGQGAFSEVHRVRYSVNTDEDGMDDGSNTKMGIYAMKHLRPKLLSQPDNFRLAATELAMEAHMLASFDHPNIVKIHGWAANGVASFAQDGEAGRHDSFFLLLDCLDETLEQRIAGRWSRQQSRRKRLVASQSEPLHVMADLWRRFSQQEVAGEAGVRDRQRALDTQAEQLLELEKMGVLTELASALAYLHSLGVIYRDLKPNNVGFDSCGRVKLFDFGLSRELPDCSLTQPFEMSGKVGTLRYMATEVASHLPYNVSADVYSWAMVAYEVLTLQKPFSGWTREMHANLVCGRGVRPDLQEVESRELRGMLNTCWGQTAHHRPNMQLVHHQMRILEEQALLDVQRTAAAAAALQLQQLPVVSTSSHHEEDVHAELPGARKVDRVRKLPKRNPSAMSQAFTSRHDGNGDVRVELPADFNVDYMRKPPTWNQSAYTASTAMSSSNDSSAMQQLQQMQQQQHHDQTFSYENP